VLLHRRTEGQARPRRADGRCGAEERTDGSAGRRAAAAEGRAGTAAVAMCAPAVDEAWAANGVVAAAATATTLLKKRKWVWGLKEMPPPGAR